jgi:hypothetical protein
LMRACAAALLMLLLLFCELVSWDHPMQQQ